MNDLEDVVDVEKELREYQMSPVVQKLNDYYNELSFLDILKVDRKENYHSNFLKWIFEDYELSKISVKCFLLLLLKRNKQQKNSHFPDEVKSAILTNSFNIENIETKVEDFVDTGKSKGRSDVLITVKYNISNSQPKNLYIIIENKVESEEHNSQTQTYFDNYTITNKDKYGKDTCIFVFLTPIPSIELDNLKESSCVCKAFIQINYQDLLDNIFSVLIDNELIQERKRFIIKEYIKALSINYSQKNRKSKKNNIIMAIDPTYQKLLIDFWNNNERLITLSIEALKSDPSLDSKTRAAIKETSKGVQKIKESKDTTSYKFGTQQCKSKPSIVFAILKYCIDDKKMTADEIQKKWTDFIQEKNNSFDKNRVWTFSHHEDAKMKFSKINNEKYEALIFDEKGYNEACKKAQNSGNERRFKQLKEHDFNIGEICNKKYFYFSDWHWTYIDFAIKFYLDKIKGKNDPDIEIIP